MERLNEVQLIVSERGEWTTVSFTNGQVLLELHDKNHDAKVSKWAVEKLVGKADP